MASSTLASALILCSLCPLGLALGALSNPGGPDALSTNSTSIQGDSGVNVSSTSSPSSPPVTTPAQSTVSSNTASPSVSVTSGGVSNSNSASTTAYTSGSVGMDLSYIPVDLKSLDNPHWVSFLDDVARQTSRNLEDLRANGVNDPQIGSMWDVYVQTIGDGAGLPFTGGASSSTFSTSSSSSSSSSSSFSPSFSSGTGSTVVQDSPVMSPLMESGGQNGPASAPSVNNNWFQSFFKDGSQQSSDMNTNSYTSSRSSYNPPYQSTGSAGSTYRSTSQYTTNPSSGSESMAQMFSLFRPSSSSQYQGQPYSSQSQPSMTWGSNTNIAQRFVDMVSPVLMQSLSSQTPQSRTQQSTSWQSPQLGSSPDSGWGGRSQRQQPTQQPQKVAPKLSNEAMDQLTMELMVLLGKLPQSALSSTPSPLSSSQQSQQSQTAPQTQSNTQNVPQIQIQTQTQAPPTLLPTTPKTPGTPVFSSNILNTNQVQSSNKLNSGALSSLADLGSQMSGMAMTSQQFPSLTGGSSLTGSSLTDPSLPSLSLTGPSMMGPSDPMNVLRPVAQFYNARFDARASRDLGCKTLGEMLDMDVPRPFNLNCNRLCPSIMPGAVTGKRFGLTCLCCPVYVSDRAIGIRSMYRRAEALT